MFETESVELGKSVISKNKVGERLKALGSKYRILSRVNYRVKKWLTSHVWKCRKDNDKTLHVVYRF